MENIFKTKKINNPLSGEITIPPDKSISHRSLIFGALTKGKIKIKNLSLGADCICTLKILENLGVKYNFLSKRDLILDSSKGFIKSKVKLNCGNSGTTARLMAGLLAGQNFKSELFGDESLSHRPMERIIKPLSLMGAIIHSNNNKMPLIIEGQKLKSIEYRSPIPSAQIKSALLLAGMHAEGETIIREENLSRNHSEIMLEYLGADIEYGRTAEGYYTKIKKSNLKPRDIEIAGDISSAAFFMVAASIVKGSHILIKNVGINPTRAGILDVFEQAGINYKLLNKRMLTNEPCADIEVKYSENIKPFKIEGSLIPRLIDEIPILAVLASTVDGESIIKDAKDLRNKESDRIKTISDTFSSIGINIIEQDEGFIIKGGKIPEKPPLHLKTFLDHRLAMSYYVLSLICDTEFEIEGFNCINTSFPEFLEIFEKIQNNEGVQKIPKL